MKATRGELKKLEEIFKTIDYKLRYEKGHFQSGYCIIETQNVAIVNRFFDVEGRINTLIQLLIRIDPQQAQMDDVQWKTYQKWLKHLTLISEVSS